MSTKPVRWFGLGLGLLLVSIFAASIRGPAPARAAPPAPSAAAPACITCHERQYYLYDTGHWYCVAEASQRCVNCHGGDAGALTEADAHAGLVANPFADGGVHCRDCHGAEADALIDQVSSLTGFHTSLEVEPYAAPDTRPAVSLPDESEAPLWIVPVAFLVFGLWAWLVLRSSRS